MEKYERGTRSYTMSHIRGKDTKIEVLVRSYLFRRGLRFRKNDKRYPGHPDVVLPKYHTIVFVNGCFWHMHEGCSKHSMPKSNVAFEQIRSAGVMHFEHLPQQFINLGNIGRRGPANRHVCHR